MNLHQAASIRTASTPVEGELYTINYLSVSYTDDQFNPGKQRVVLILGTDKGSIYAPNSIVRAYMETVEDEGEDAAADCLVGSTVKAVKRVAKKFKKEFLTFEWVDDLLE